MVKRECNQTRCGYFIAGQGCKNCDECRIEPFMVDDECDRCWNCEHDEGLLRWDENIELEEDIEIIVPMLHH